MPKLVRIDSSVMGDYSVSKMLADDFQEKWLAKYPNGEVVLLDLTKEELPHINNTFVQASFTDEAQQTEEQKQALQTSKQLINELKSADYLLISTPMYNFSVPSSLKAYFDHIALAGETFEYSSEGPKGLLTNLNASIIMASGGDYTQPPYNAMDFASPYIQTFLSFLGITVDQIHVAPSTVSDAKDESIAKVKQAIESHFE